MAASVSAKLIARLKELRKLRKFTQEEFSEISGISYKYYQALEAGRKKDIRLSTLERLARAYGLDLWQLFSPHLATRRLLAKNLKAKSKSSI